MAVAESVLAAAWALAAAGLAWYAISVAKEVAYVTLADGRRQERSLPFSFKVLLPFSSNFYGLVSRPAFAKSRAAADISLVAAGYEGLLDGRDFATLKILCPVALGGVWCLAVALGGAVFPGSLFETMRLPLCLAGVALLCLQPDLWLKAALKKRHHSIAKALPFVLDMLTLSVEAGMDFIGAIQRCCELRKIDPLNEELLRMVKEIQVGSPRKAALKAMAARCGQPDLRSVANALVQADELGVPVGPMLRIQSRQMRDRRFDRATRLANEAPTKMLGPLMLCIFPAVFIMLLGPVAMQAAKGLL